MVPDYPKITDFPIVSHQSGTVPVYVDPKDSWLVNNSVRLLVQDIYHVTGSLPEIITDLTGAPYLPNLIIVGSMDSSSLIRELMQKNMLAKNMQGQWESYMITTVSKPMIGIGRALVIAGTDRRGTAYGIFELSRQMGVSPWYYWADVPIPHRNPLFVSNRVFRSDGPAVKYRGFFINDEAPALSGWTKQKFGGFNHFFYERVFELLLRLKANYLWPAMWGSAFNDDDTLNPVLASQYGIVMGTSHHEPMLRAQQEWKRYGTGPWDYTTNSQILDSFWTTGIQHMDSHESIVTVGMRGDGDKPMIQEGSSNANVGPSAGPPTAAIGLLEKIVSDQRAIIQKVTGKAPSATPQSWALYKEVQDYYDKGMRVPDDITLLLCDDNWGNVRKLPLPGEKPRAGGYGLYYHFDYVGGPRNYKWINTNQLPRIWEQLHLTKAYGADHLWIVNVGDIKPLEFPTQFFLDYAWNPAAIKAKQIPAYTLKWATQQFGSTQAPAIADILTKYTQYNARRKPELLSPDTYSLLNYREAEIIAGDYKQLADKATAIGHQLPAAFADAYYELVLYPVLASANLNELYYTVERNRYDAAQGRALTNELAVSADSLFRIDSLLARTYNNDIASGKWSHMMDQTHIGYTSWQEPRYNKEPNTNTIDLTAATGSSWGLAVEGSIPWWPEEKSAATLPPFNPYDHNDHFIDIFNRRSAPFSYTVKTNAPWIIIGRRSQSVDKEERLWIGIDWSRLPHGVRQSTLTITGPDSQPVTVTVPLDPLTPTPPASFRGFLETGGCIAIEAEHFAKATGSNTISWHPIPGLGRTLSAMEAFPVTAPPQTPGPNSPHLDYRIWLFDTGTIHIQTYCSPILAFNQKPIHYAIALDDDPPQLIDLSTGNEARGSWDKMVADNIRIAISAHAIRQPGAHILKFFLVDPGVVLQRIVVDPGGVKPSYLGPPESPTNSPQ